MQSIIIATIMGAVLLNVYITFSPPEQIQSDRVSTSITIENIN
jgi:hypothetical protein